jgi:group I intron endonuclease
MYGIIYKATSPTGKVYIGQTVQPLERRKRVHLCHSKISDTYFQRAIRKYGFDIFIWDEIDTAENAEELNAKEIYWISFYKSNNPNYGYNNQEGGMGGIPNTETRQKMSKALKGNKRMVGKRHSEETRRKIGEAQVGNKKSLGKRRTEETCRKVSQALLGHSVSEETRIKLSNVHKGKHLGTNNENAKLTEEQVREIKIAIANGETGAALARKYGVGHTTISGIKSGRVWAWLKIPA